MRKLLPILMALLGVGAGVGAGVMLKPAPTEATQPDAQAPPEQGAAHSAAPEKPPTTHAASGQGSEPGKDTGFDYVKLNNQFIIPVIKHGKVASLVVLSLSLEITAGENKKVFSKEPKLRDAFLQVLFDHANAGGFDGDFTNSRNMLILRDSLREVAKKTIGPVVSDVLVLDIVRQDMASR